MGLADIDRDLSTPSKGLAAIDRDLQTAKTTTAPAKPPDDQHGVAVGAVLDTLGLTNRPGAVPLTGAPGTKTPLGVVLNPEGVLERATSLAVTVPATYAGGALVHAARVPAALGRIATSGILGGAGAASRGESIGWGAAIDAAVAAITEGTGAYAAKGLKPLGEAFEAIKSRLPPGKWINAPSLASGKMTAEEAVKKLSKLRGEAYQQARAELASEFNRLDKQIIAGPRPLAGSAFKMRTNPTRSAYQRVAEHALTGEWAPGVKSLADAAATQKIEGAPAGYVGERLAENYLADKARYLWHLFAP